MRRRPALPYRRLSYRRLPHRKHFSMPDESSHDSARLIPCTRTDPVNLRIRLLLPAVTVVLLVGGSLTYVTYQHPGLAGPLGAGAAVAALLVSGLKATVGRK